jgi:arylsulfatase A-like enzyme
MSKYSTKNFVLKGSLLTGHVLFSLSLAAANPQRPNIIFILTDDQSSIPLTTNTATQSRPFGFNGDSKVYTPIIDSLAKNGMIFPNAFVASTVSAASRYSILTGRYAGRCQGVEFTKQYPVGTFARVENNIELEKTFDNLPRLLQKAGYRTGFVGKSHVIEHQFLETGKLATDGFITYLQSDDPKNNLVNAAMINNHNLWVNKIKEYGFDYANAVNPANLKELNNDSLNVHNVEWKNKAALDFIDQAGSEPFFLYYSESIPHGPAPWTMKNGKYVSGLDANPKFTSSGYIDVDYSYLPSRSAILKEITEMSGKDRNAAWLRWFDYAVGALVKKLKDKGLLENTLIVLTSDHGEYNHGKTTLYEGGIRVPLMMYWPAGIKAGSQYNDLVQNIDFTPTFLDLADAHPNTSNFDGVSLKEVVLGNQTSAVHDFLFFELGYARAAMTRDWKYISVRYDDETQLKIDNGFRFPGFIKGETMTYPYYVRNSSLGYYAATNNSHYFEKDQLYDLKNDPTEQVNVVSQNTAKVNELKLKLKLKLETFYGRPYGEFYDGAIPNGFRQIAINQELKIYPNPSNDIFKVKFPERCIHSNYTIYNSEGKKVVSQQIESDTASISLKEFPACNYVIKVMMENQSYTGRLCNKKL